MNRRTWITTLASGLLSAAVKSAKLFRPQNLIAWCVVPFDANNRGPEERAQMLKRLGFTMFVWDWRDKHLPEFDAEVAALKKHGVKLQGLWVTSDRFDTILALVTRHKLKTELWYSFTQDKEFRALPDDRKLEVTVEAVGKAAKAAQAAGCKLGLYNHRGWFGEPENQLAIIKRVNMPNVGIVYNFHHAHTHVARFPELLAMMKPYLYAININGMKEGEEILPVGSGNQELGMLQAIQRSGYQGPIGILGHRPEVDVELALTANLRGLRSLPLN